MIETDAGIVIPMHESDIWELGQRAVPERESRWETEELLAFWAFPNTPEEDVGQWCLVWRRTAVEAGRFLHGYPQREDVQAGT